MSHTRSVLSIDDVSSQRQSALIATSVRRSLQVSKCSRQKLLTELGVGKERHAVGNKHASSSQDLTLGSWMV
jgi:hypothetical protein